MLLVKRPYPGINRTKLANVSPLQRHEKCEQTGAPTADVSLYELSAEPIPHYQRVATLSA